ncbi:hypothetical protein [Actinoallomurus sp. CA-142502]|uniref:hypothetical protein n=1 Tax=Actinoallomurus sp. CA-142502 TaxID=3239885 RepID=UPI003D8F7DF5
MSDEPSNGELKRLLERDHAETSSAIAKLETQLGVALQQLSMQFKDYVLKEVWQTERDALREQLGEVKEEVTTARRRAANAVWAAAGTLVTSLILIAFKGGH